MTGIEVEGWAGLLHSLKLIGGNCMTLGSKLIPSYSAQAKVLIVVSASA